MNNFTEWGNMGTAYSTALAKRDVRTSLKATYRKSSLPFIADVLEGRKPSIMEDLISTATIALLDCVKDMPIVSFSALYAVHEGWAKREVYKAIQRAIWAERKCADMEDVAQLQIETEEAVMSTECLSEDYARALVYGLPKKADKALYLRCLEKHLLGYTAVQIGKEMGISKQRVGQILIKCREICEHHAHDLLYGYEM